MFSHYLVHQALLIGINIARYRFLVDIRIRRIQALVLILLQDPPMEQQLCTGVQLYYNNSLPECPELILSKIDNPEDMPPNSMQTWK